MYLIHQKMKKNRKRNYNKNNSESEFDSKNSVSKNILDNDNNQEKKSKNENENESEIEQSVYQTDFEINTMTYKDAIEKDNRSYFEYYKSLLKMHQIFLFILNGNKDFNSYIMKICLLLFSFALNMMINSLFFNDSFLQRIYLDKGKYNFIYSLPRIIYSLLISSIIFFLFKHFFLIFIKLLRCI